MLLATLIFLVTRTPLLCCVGTYSIFDELCFGSMAFKIIRESESCDPFRCRSCGEPCESPRGRLWSEKRDWKLFISVCTPFVLAMPYSVGRLAAQRPKPTSIIIMYMAAVESTARLSNCVSTLLELIRLQSSSGWLEENSARGCQCEITYVISEYVPAVACTYTTI